MKPHMIYFEKFIAETEKLGLSEMVNMAIKEGLISELKMALILHKAWTLAFYGGISAERCAEVTVETFKEAYVDYTAKETKH